MIGAQIRGRLRIRHLMSTIAVFGLAFATWADSLKPGTIDPTRHVYSTIAGSFPATLDPTPDPYSQVIMAAPIASFGVLFPAVRAYRSRRRSTARRSAPAG